MDSKLKRMTILAAVSVGLLTVLTVLLLNNPFEQGGLESTEPSETARPNTGAVFENGQIGNDLSAFMRDETFFDAEDNEFLENLKNEQNRLSLIVTSVEKDLRIQIVDSNNQPVSGESFFVTLKGMGDYKDLDKDGVIYIGDLAAGDYEVSLKPIEGYKVPSGATKVRVKDKVEYLVIEDISLLIKTEAEIDAEAEDTAQAVHAAHKNSFMGARAGSVKACVPN
ncbi:MAG: prealbumin-like fold domain-containing protein, partial [Lachnospiraceae bacterium]|nr:prealbumin-like fold domain-containing protein [Lachnospiraceae bacterium]